MKYTVSALFYWVKRGLEKQLVGGDLKIAASGVCLGCMIAIFRTKKKIKIKYGFEDSVSNFHLGLFWPNNQLMLFW